MQDWIRCRKDELESHWPAGLAEKANFRSTEKPHTYTRTAHIYTHRKYREINMGAGKMAQQSRTLAILTQKTWV